MQKRSTPSTLYLSNPRMHIFLLYCMQALLCLTIFNACSLTTTTLETGQQKTQASSQISASDSNPTPHPTNEAAFDPCILLSKNDIASALGGPVNLQPDIITPLCEFALAGKTSANSSSSASNQSEIVVSIGSSDDAHAYMALDRLSNGQQSNVSTIPDLGDQAFLIKTTMGLSAIVSQGSLIYGITYLNPPKSAHIQNVVIHLATLADKSLANATPTLPIPNPQPCTVVNAHQASGLMQNSAVKWMSMVNDAGVSSCTYLSTTGGAQQQVQIVITNNARAAKPVYQTARSYVAQNQLEDLPGIGDAAFYDGAGSLWVLKNDSVFHISVFGSPATEAQIVALGRSSLSFF